MTSRTYFQLAPFALDRILKSNEFVKDARIVAAVSTESFSNALDAVEQASGFVGRQRLLSAIQIGIHDEVQAESLTNFIMNFNSLQRDLDASPDDFAQEVSSRLPEGTLTESERRTLIERLPRVLAPKAGLDLQAKAESVVQRTGSHLDELSIVSDLRPIFDESRERIEGLVPMATLKLVVHAAGEVNTVEVRITEEEVSRICEEAERAKLKFAVLKAFIKRQSGIELPESIMTLSETSDA